MTLKHLTTKVLPESITLLKDWVFCGVQRNLEAELTDRGAHAIHRVVILAWVPWVLYKPFNRPQLDLLRGELRKAYATFHQVILEDPSRGCALRWPVEPI